MIDDPFDTVLNFIEKNNVNVLGHLGEPRKCMHLQQTAWRSSMAIDDILQSIRSNNSSSNKEKSILRRPNYTW